MFAKLIVFRKYPVGIPSTQWLFKVSKIPLEKLSFNADTNACTLYPSGQIPIQSQQNNVRATFDRTLP